jgi:hypothetical protein
MSRRSTLPAVLLALFSLGAHAAPPFSWEVPGEVSRVDVDGLQWVRGIPVKLESATSKLPAPKLLEHFAQKFRAHQLFIPPAKDQLVVKGALQLTALDVDRLLSYTVMLRPLQDGKGTQVLMSTTLLSAARTESTSFVPLPPGATSVLTVDVEAGRSVTFAVPAQPEQVSTFYRQALAPEGYREKEPGVFARGAETLRIHTRPLEDGRLAVVVRSQLLPEAATPAAPPEPVDVSTP